MRFNFWQAVSVLGIGLGLGWIIGLSSAPVVSQVLTSLFVVVVALATALQAPYPQPQQDGNKPPEAPRTLLDSLPRIDARPTALLVLGIALAATGGLTFRTKFFPDSTNANSQIVSGGLRNTLTEFCPELLPKIDDAEKLRQLLNDSGESHYVGLAKNSDKAMIEEVKKICGIRR